MNRVSIAALLARLSRQVLTRVIVGLLIGMGMFYFKSAHAATLYQYNSNYNSNNHPNATVTCAVGSRYATVNDLVIACTKSSYTYTFGSNTYTNCRVPATWTLSQGNVNVGYSSSGCSTVQGTAYSLAVTTVQGTLCTAGTVVGTGSTSGSSSFSSGICSSGCLATATVGGNIEVDVGGTKAYASGDATTQWTLTGASCPSSPAPPALKQSPTCVGLACAVAGPSAPAKATGNNTTINNTQNFYTHTDGSASVNSNTPTPPGPNAGEAGVPAAVSNSYTVTINGSPITYNYYTQTTINNSYNGDGSLGDRSNPVDADGDGDASGGEDPVTPPDQPQEQPTEECTGPECVLCGAPGQPICEVSIVEETPFAPPTGGHVYSDLAAERTAAEQELTGKLATIRQEAAGLFGTITTETDCPVFSVTVPLLNKTLVFNFCDWSTQLNYLAMALVLLSLVAAAFIILG